MGLGTRYLHKEQTLLPPYEDWKLNLPCEDLKTLSISTIAQEGTTAIEQASYPFVSEALSAQVLEEATWTFYLHAMCEVTAGSTKGDAAGSLRAIVYLRRNTTETFLFTSGYSTGIRTQAEVQVSGVCPEQTLRDGDRIVVYIEMTLAVNGAKTGPQPRWVEGTFHFYCDTSAKNSRAVTPPPPPPAAWKFTENLSVISAVPVRRYSGTRSMREDLSRTGAISAVFSRIVAYKRRASQQPLIRDVFERSLRVSRVFRQVLSSIRDVFSSFLPPVPAPSPPPVLKAVRVRFVRRVTYLREVPQEVVVRDRFRSIRRFLRRLRQDLSAIRDVFRFVYTPVVRAYKFIQDLSVTSVRIRRFQAFPRKFIENLSILRDVFLRRVSYSRRFVNSTLIKEFFIRKARYLRRLIQIIIIQVKFSFVFKPIIKVYRFVQTIVISALFRRRVSLRRRIREDLSVIKARFVRRAAYVRKLVEVVYVQVKAIIKKIKKWLAWLTRRMRLSIERPQHAEFKL